MRLILAIGFLLGLIAGCTSLEVEEPLPSDSSAVTSSGDTRQQQTGLPPNTVAGVVVDEEDQPVTGAVVRVQATENHTQSDENGRFQLEDVPLDEPVSITAWAEGFFISNAYATAESPWVTIEIHRFLQEDNPLYEWLTAGSLTNRSESQGCAECHSSGEVDTLSLMPFDEWVLDAHSQSALNIRVLSTYNGTDVHGNQSPMTAFVLANPSRHNSADYTYIALAPDPEQPYYGPGYKLDFPDSAGNCANCHVPVAAAGPGMNFAVDVNLVEEVALEGVTCDLCHKVWDVQLDPESGLPYPDMPGVMSYQFMRPPEGHQFFAGPLDDVAPGEDTYSPLQQESQYCAGCHFGTFWDNNVYNSFGEWLASPYSNPQAGQTCQDCHMPALGATHFARPDMGGLERDPSTVFTHNMTGVMEDDLLQNAVSLQVSAEQDDGKVIVEIQVTNDKTGHHVPTGYPGRQLILLVQAYDQSGSLLVLENGPTLPDWCGIGDPAGGYYAGLPGEAYAKILQEDWTGHFPTVAYWNPFTVLQDNRIAAFETAFSEFTFENPSAGRARVEVQLLLRRSFRQLMDWKDWDVPDVLMEEVLIVLDS